MNTTNQFTNGVQGFVEDLSLVPIPPWWQSPWFILAVLVAMALLALAGRRIYLRLHLKMGGRSGTQSLPSELPHIAALRELEQLRRRRAELGGYALAIACSAILRRYIEARFTLGILYQTTREFLNHARTHEALAVGQRESLGQYLRFCDMIKFARHGTTDAETVQLIEFAVAFVTACIPTATEPAKPPGTIS